eukprot:scaffold44657_cov71-Phaeocystis_antarctica.AAC.2
MRVGVRVRARVRVRVRVSTPVVHGELQSRDWADCRIRLAQLGLFGPWVAWAPLCCRGGEPVPGNSSPEVSNCCC